MSVTLEPLACNGCGAELDLPDDARFVTCTYCKARLVVKRDGGAAYTEVRKSVERVEKKTKKLEGDVKKLRRENRVLQLQNDLEALERDWDQRSRDLMIRKKNGELVVPQRSTATVMGVIALVVFGAAALYATTTKASGTFWAAGLGGPVLIGIMALALHTKAVAYEKALAEYHEEREELTDEIHRLRRGKKR